MSPDMTVTPALLMQAVEKSGVAMCIRDTRLKPVYANQAFLDFYGYTMEEISEIHVRDILPWNTYDLYQKTVIPFLVAGKSWEGEYYIRSRGEALPHMESVRSRLRRERRIDPCYLCHA